MSEKKIKKLELRSLKIGQVVWSEYFQAYIKFEGLDIDDDFFFNFVDKRGYCIIYNSDVFEPPSLIKELL